MAHTQGSEIAESAKCRGFAVKHLGFGNHIPAMSLIRVDDLHHLDQAKFIFVAVRDQMKMKGLKAIPQQTLNTIPRIRQSTWRKNHIHLSRCYRREIFLTHSSISLVRNDQLDIGPRPRGDSMHLSTALQRPQILPATRWQLI